MKVHLRYRKLRKKGWIAVYLEYYKGSAVGNDGKRKNYREFENLGLYLHKNPRTKKERDEDRETNELAESIRSKRELEAKGSEHGLTTATRLSGDFVKYFQDQAESHQDSPGNYSNWKGALKHFLAYAGSNKTFREIDKSFCEGFKEYLEKRARSKSGKELSRNTVLSYFNKFRACLNEAVKDGILQQSPAKDVVLGKGEEVEREFLTNEELAAIAKTPCRYPLLKKAFLFSCLTGLRWSDIEKLKWQEVQQRDGKWYIAFRQKKTKGFQYHPIKDSAKELLGERGNPEDKIFDGLRYDSHMSLVLKQWVLQAGISKNITFHCGRHTFAVLFLNNGGDIYTLKELLGHTSIRTTEVYAKIVNKKKEESLDVIPDIHLGEQSV